MSRFTNDYDLMFVGIMNFSTITIIVIVLEGKIIVSVAQNKL